MDVIIGRPKKFESMESLWYEEERLATFIDWPIKFISEKDLASDGFYYLRTKDHCACAFCRGIIGAWEEGDTPRDEHKRHFPHCPFVQGKVTANVPLSQGRILSKIARDFSCTNLIEENKLNSISRNEDVCGNSKSQPNDCLNYQSDVSTAPKSFKDSKEISLKNLGFKEYCGPKRKDYITLEERLRSFKHWPEKVSQEPQSMAEAGFFYCGLSDHVRCFHCGNGLRNWEVDDQPWVEHARWYPDCHFVLLQKGIDFVDKIQRERPPYISQSAKETIFSTKGASNSKSNSSQLNDYEFEHLMELPIMKEVLSMGFTEDVCKTALMKKITETGLPFFYLEAAIEAILLLMDEETKRTLKGCEEITSQARSRALTGPPLPAELSRQSLTTEETQTLPHIRNNGQRVENCIPVPPLSFQRASPPLRASTPTSQREQRTPMMEFISAEPSNDTENIRNIQIPNIESASRSATERLTPENTRISPLLSEADEIIEEAAKHLATPNATSSIYSSQSTSESSQDSGTGIDKESDMETLSSSGSEEEKEEKPIKLFKNETETENLALELEKIKETRTCRVCMDQEMDVVFLPCTHMVACSTCAVALSSCPICRRDIQYAFKPIIS